MNPWLPAIMAALALVTALVYFVADYWRYHR